MKELTISPNCRPLSRWTLHELQIVASNNCQYDQAPDGVPHDVAASISASIAKALLDEQYAGSGGLR